ncbi:MAG: cobalt-precorrin-5B (C(1))-methyltransferase CbiD [Bacteroides sp.]|nr:cobalt-precorrin-5B (C(1))-methyltransferase CbiD [Eubacterium sp.]MCM1417865.1 cobalt-precorrin-5B (C(1))-methyltransferase CbiD [Roseburia sp.]MCM1461304.1 cobalt-precorrin-5B (C(1))-methyltransferase CbiD [Bacteroides sp.]
MEGSVYRGGRMLRLGFTTGSCAALAAKAAARALITGETPDFSEIVTPNGTPLRVRVEEAAISDGFASCAVKKDGGDDPDATNGLLIFAEVSRIPSGVEITGGVGIGRVTKTGLDQPVGEYAINSVPRRMIAAAIEEVAEKYETRGGFRVTIYAPEGAEVAKKTYNPRMGIEGGISVIGTTGIVEPMSNAALIETIRLEEKMRRAEGHKSLLLTLGNYSGNFIAEKMPFALGKSVKCSNFIGEALDAAIELGFKNALIVGHIGKLVKLGAGIMNTHSGQADGRMDVLVTCGVLAGADVGLLKKLPDCATTDAALALLSGDEAFRRTLDILAERAAFYLNARVKNALTVGAVMFSDKHGVVVKTPSYDRLFREIAEEYDG